MRHAILAGLFAATLAAAGLPAAPALAAPPTAVQVSAGTQDTCIVDSTAGARCWGANYDGQLGTGSMTDSPTAANVVGLASGVVQIANGHEHTCAVTTSGAAKCWGYNISGQIGDGTAVSRLSPVTVSGLSSGVAQIVGGYGHTCALTTPGGVMCWGYNNTSQLGDGSTTNRLTPVNVSGLSSGVVAITAGAFHTCALMSSGSVMCWGWNTTGQLGDGTTTMRPSPVTVSGLSNAAAISAGGFHTCAVTTSGAAKCWGRNYDGELGDGTTTFQTSPVDVYGLSSGVAAIAGGGLHTCALTGAGGMKCWGNDNDGELGDGGSVDSSVPVNVSGLTSGVDAIGAGYQHTCAIKTSGPTSCWGRNPYGQLGDGTTTPSALPVSVLGLSGVSVDTDGDRCPDDAEIRTMAGSETTGGRRSPLNFWDFFDTPNANNVRNGSIDLFYDVFGVANRFGANDSGGAAAINRNSDPLSPPPPAPAYHPAFDRSARPPGGDLWDLGQPDGTIDLFADIFGAAVQFGHHC